MRSREDLPLRLANASDAEAIAALHADSWRRHYRGAYSDGFLDGDVISDRLAVWADRLQEPAPLAYTILVEEGESLIGFAHTAFDEDATWGALLDNLHVAHGHKGRGIGSQLLTLTAAAVIKRRTGLYLWVQEQNLAAQAFYDARGEMHGSSPDQAARRGCEPAQRLASQAAIRVERRTAGATVGRAARSTRVALPARAEALARRGPGSWLPGCLCWRR